jgi:hypothetical protein
MTTTTFNLVSDILSGKVSFVDLASAGQSATKGQALEAAVSAASGLQAMGAVISNTVGKAAVPVLVASAFNDYVKIRAEINSPTGKITNETALGALSTAASAVAALTGGALAVGMVAAPAAMAIAATAIVASAALGVAALAAHPNDTRMQAAVANLLMQTQTLATQKIDGPVDRVAITKIKQSDRVHLVVGAA